MRRNRRILVWLPALALCIVPLAASAEEEPAGKGIFLAQKCNMCHSVQSAGIESKARSEAMKAADLTGVSAKRDRDWLVKYLRREIQLKGKDHKKKTDKLTDEDLDTLLAWLSTQE